LSASADRRYQCHLVAVGEDMVMVSVLVSHGHNEPCRIAGNAGIPSDDLIHE
jgi:hypothetical protein